MQADYAFYFVNQHIAYVTEVQKANHAFLKAKKERDFTLDFFSVNQLHKLMFELQ